MGNWEIACLAAYCAIVLLLGVYGFHRYQLLRLFHKHRQEPAAFRERFTTLPLVTVQLPLYNEFHVVERLLEAVARIDYPRDRLQIQVLDDSQDETRERAWRMVQRLAAAGLDIEYIHRRSRLGFKAGALDAGLARARGEFILILDADFVPQAQILHQAIHCFTDPEIGMVQMRWGYLNRGYSLLTHLQSIFLDGHFVIEHTARNRSGRLFNFNGSYRKKAYTYKATGSMLSVPERLSVTGGDTFGFAVLAGKSKDGDVVQVLMSNYEIPAKFRNKRRWQSPDFKNRSSISYRNNTGYNLVIKNLPWGDAEFSVARYRVSRTDDFELITESAQSGGRFSLERPLPPPALELIILKRK